MTIAQSIARAIEALPPEKQHEALALIEQMVRERGRPLINPEGIAAHVSFDMSLEDFQLLRREMWGTSTEHETEWPH